FVAAGPGTVSVGHIYFPLIPGYLLDWLTRWGVYSKNDPHYFEKAFAFYSLPSRLLAALGLWSFYRILRLHDKSRFEAMMGTAFLAVTFGFWFWPLQSNAVGFLIPYTTFALYVTVASLKSRRTLFIAFSALMTSLIFYVHVSSAFVVLGMGSVTAAALLR